MVVADRQQETIRDQEKAISDCDKVVKEQDEEIKRLRNENDPVKTGSGILNILLIILMIL